MNSYVLYFLISLFALPSTVFAVLPPDIIFSLGTQLWQVVVGVGALVVGSVTALFPFMRSATYRVPRQRVLLMVIGSAIVLSGLAYFIYLIAIKIPVRNVPPPQPAMAVISAATSTHEFHSDRFVFSGQYANGAPILVDLIVNRKGLDDGSFVHYYLLNLIDKKIAKKIYSERTVAGHEVLSDLFFTQFARATSTDHSARDSYEMTFQQSGKTFHIRTGELSADFMTKNEPEYTAYVSVGTSTLLFGNESVALHVMHERVYSSDYRKTIFFDGSDTLPSETIQLVFWDELGNFYLVDHSLVKASSSAYSTHFWALMKDGDGYVKRAYRGDARAIHTATSTHFLAAVPDFQQATFSLDLKQPFSEEQEKGLVSGAVEDALGLRMLSGQGYFNIYGK